MPNLVITGDWHVTDRPNLWAFLEKFTERHQKDVVIIAGDLFDLRHRTPLRVVDRLISYLLRLESVCLIPGQHDLDNKGEFIIPEIFFLANVYLVTKPYSLTFAGTTFELIPYSRDVERLRGWLQQTAAPVVVSHFPLAECLPQGKAPLSVQDLPPKVYFLGDIHNGLDYQHSGTLVRYTGQPAPRDWRDRYARQSYLVITPEGDVSRVDSPVKTLFVRELPPTTEPNTFYFVESADPEQVPKDEHVLGVRLIPPSAEDATTSIAVKTVDQVVQDWVNTHRTNPSFERWQEQILAGLTDVFDQVGS